MLTTLIYDMPELLGIEELDYLGKSELLFMDNVLNINRKIN